MAENGPDTWVLDNSDSNSPTMAWNAEDVDENSDQRLVSPSIVLPSGASAPVLKFWTRFDIEEDSPTACYDGAILEVSTDGGSNWAQVANEDLLTLQYNGPVDDGFNNVLAGLDAWCDEQDWIQAVVDLSGLDGETLNFISGRDLRSRYSRRKC